MESCTLFLVFQNIYILREKDKRYFLSYIARTRLYDKLLRDQPVISFYFSNITHKHYSSWLSRVTDTRILRRYCNIIMYEITLHEI